MAEKLNILIVDDNTEHLKLTRYILQRNSVAGDVFVARDGEEAIDFLFRRNKFADPVGTPRPHVILLDFNIPRLDGREVLRIIKEDALLKEIPVVVISSSSHREDVSMASKLGATAYISKSSGFDKLNEELAALHRFVPRPEE